MRAKKLLTQERLNEITGVFFLLIGLFTLVSLLFFHPSDHSFYTTYPNQNYQNITGIIGVYLAHYLHLTFGFSSFSLAGLFLFWSACFFLQKVPKKSGLNLLELLSQFFPFPVYLRWLPTSPGKSKQAALSVITLR